jgi:hypothetical protein
MTTMAEHYRNVFRGPGGTEVLGDLTRYVQRLPAEHRGAAALVVVRITQMLMTEDGPQRLHVRGLPASGGRIAHGSG